MVPIFNLTLAWSDYNKHYLSDRCVSVNAVNFTEAPCSGLMNTAVIVGSRVTFDCHYHDPSNYILWYRYKLVNNTVPKREQVSSGSDVRKEFKDRYEVKIDLKNKRASLSINAVQLEDAGLYALQQSSGGFATCITVDLIVLGKYLLSNIYARSMHCASLLGR